jgi:phosphohistidine phosphatase
MQVGFDMVLFSPKVRARRTAELAAEGWEPELRERLCVHPPLAAGFRLEQALEAMAGLGAGGRLLLVGHEPDLSGVAGELCGGRVELKKGGLAVVRLQGASGELLVLLRPVELALIAGVGVAPIDG